MIPQVLDIPAAWIARSDIVQICDRASAAPAAVGAVLADNTVVPAVRAICEYSKERAVPNILKGLVPQIVC